MSGSDRIPGRDTAATLDEDRRLAAAIARQDPAAMEQVYDRYSAPIFALCLRILRDRMQAEELLGDVCMELWRKVDRYDPDRGSLLTYLLTLTRSRCIDRVRQRRRHAAVALDGVGAEPTAEPTGDLLVAGERRQAVIAALQQLRPDQRDMLELAFFEDLSHSAIAERLGRPLGSVKTHIRQGIIQLREILRTLASSHDHAPPLPATVADRLAPSAPAPLPGSQP